MGRRIFYLCLLVALLCLGALFVGTFGLVGGIILYGQWVLVPLGACWLGWHLVRIIVGLSRRLSQER